MERPDQQHYVPQFLLRQFSPDGSDQIWAFDKHSGRSFKTNAKNVAVEKGFNDVVVGGKAISFEASLSTLEALATPIVERVSAEESLAGLDTRQRTILALFLAVQFARTRHAREMVGTMQDAIKRKAKAMGIDETAIESLKGLQEQDARLIATNMWATRAETLAAILLRKPWILLRADKAVPFVVSDHPVVLGNRRDFGPYGNLGFAVPSVEIYLPLSPTLALFVMCPLDAKEIVEGFESGKALKGTSARADELLDELGGLARGIQEGLTVTATSENVRRQNVLQIIHSSRFLFGASDDFSLAIEYLSEFPAHKTGLLPKTD